MIEEMWLLILRKAKENFEKGGDACPFCQLARLRKVRDIGFSTHSTYDICEYCDFQNPSCAVLGRAMLLVLEAKFDKSEWANKDIE